MFIGIGRIALVFSLFYGSLAAAGDLTIEDDGYQVLVADRGKSFFAFVYTPPAAPESASDAPFIPSHYVHPLLGLMGETITADTTTIWQGYPGIHWGWSGLGVANTLIDIERQNGGRREFERFLGASTDGGEAVFALQSAWVTDADGQARVMENLTFTLYPVAGSTRKIDITVLIRNVSDRDIYLQGGGPLTGLSLALDPARTDWGFASSGGWVSDSKPAYMSPWTVATYRDDRRSTRSGIAVLQDSRNPGYSTPNWLVEEGPRLTVGATEAFKTELKTTGFLEFRYRIILFRALGSGPDMTAEYADFMGLVPQAN